MAADRGKNAVSCATDICEEEPEPQVGQDACLQAGRKGAAVMSALRQRSHILHSAKWGRKEKGWSFLFFCGGQESLLSSLEEALGCQQRRLCTGLVNDSAGDCHAV